MQDKSSSWSFCCMFTYDSDRDFGVTRTALGTVCSWPELCREFDRNGPCCPVPGVVHFKTISSVGPKLFAATYDTFTVFYHSNSQWHQYTSARNIRFGFKEDLMKILLNDDDNDEDSSQEDSNGQDQDEPNRGRQARDFRSNSNTEQQINQTIFYYCLLRMFLFDFQTQFILLAHRSIDSESTS